ncbi:MAG: hypothetical protein Q4E55_03470 [Bacteroidales bacterium]|nr:hypothetical protein [Bacteroidales bacterium]
MTTDRHEISAELLLNYLYPELEDKWLAYQKGSFSRNYAPDVLSINPKEAIVSLSRNGFLHYLPPLFLGSEDELKASDRFGRKRKGDFKQLAQQLHERIRTLSETFLPIDSFMFRQKLKREHIVADLLARKLEFVLKTSYKFDLEAETDEYVRKVAVLLPYVAKLRGNLSFVKSLLSVVTGYPVRMRLSAYNECDNTRFWMQKVHYDICVDGLTATAYADLTKRWERMLAFVHSRFIPFDCLFEAGAKGKSEEGKIMNYNIVIKDYE